jgi:hypothetical protein
MDIQDGADTQMPAWLRARHIAVAVELEIMHGAPFAAAFLSDIGIAPDPCTDKATLGPSRP